MMAARQGHLAVFLATSGHSGVDRIMKNLLPSIAARGVRVDLLHVRTHGPYIEPSGNLRVIQLGTSHAYSSFWPLRRYLVREKPQILFSDKDRVNRIAILATLLSGVDTKVVVRTGTTVSMDLRGRKPFNRLSTYLSMKYLYRWAEKILLPSVGAVEDFMKVTGMPEEIVQAIPSPVVTPELLEKASRPCEHPWLTEKRCPVVIGIGELSWRKDFATLIKAFSSVRSGRELKLIIFGEGRQREALGSLIRSLGLESDVDLPGFTENPYSALARADLYVHSSRLEGSPVALMEAVALGIPCVSTNCPSGPAEILQYGAVGPLVEVANSQEMAAAMLWQLDAPLDRAFIQRAAQPFTLEASTAAYMAAFGF